MEVISIDGVEYIRASQLAKRFKYTSDYIGQLCRGGKVDAKLVGRTWYVNPDSLDGHKTTRYTKTGPAEKMSAGATKIEISRQRVEPVVRKETAKSITDTRSKGSNFLRRIEWKPLRYEADSADLLPPLGVSEPIKVQVDLVDAAQVKIKGGSDEVELVTEPLPEVALGGKLKVASLDDDFEKDLENIAITEEETIAAENFLPEADTENEPMQVTVKEVLVANQSKKKKVDPLNPVYPVMVHTGQVTPAVNFAPARTQARQLTQVGEVERRVSLFWWMMLLFAALLGAILLMSLEVSLGATSGSQVTTFVFTKPTL